MSEYLSKNFSYDEMVASQVASRLGIDNTPEYIEKENLKRLCKEVLQPIRDKWGAPIIVTSGYRSKDLNKAVGGSKTSQHCKGEAADIKVGGSEKNKKLFNMIMRMVNAKEIEVGQLIDEHQYSWIHVSLPRSNALNNMILHLK